MSKIDELLQFWFLPDGEKKEVMKLWFSASDSLDLEIKERFGASLRQAEQKGLDDWRQTLEGKVALIILLDQFSRNIYRGSGQAFANDTQACSLAKELIQAGLDKELDPYWRVFVYLPFEHSESLADQEQAIELFQKLAQDVTAVHMTTFKNFLDFAQKHYDVIKRFGRFPHRNQRLGRTSTPEEELFLNQPGSSFG